MPEVAVKPVDGKCPQCGSEDVIYREKTDDLHCLGCGCIFTAKL